MHFFNGASFGRSFGCGGMRWKETPSVCELISHFAHFAHAPPALLGPLPPFFFMVQWIHSWFLFLIADLLWNMHWMALLFSRRWSDSKRNTPRWLFEIGKLLWRLARRTCFSFLTETYPLLVGNRYFLRQSIIINRLSLPVVLHQFEPYKLRFGWKETSCIQHLARLDVVGRKHYYFMFWIQIGFLQGFV